MLFTLLHRAFKLCLDFENFHQKIDKLKIIFKNNGCPKCFVDFCIKKHSEKIFIKKEVVLKASKQERICVFPLIGKTSLQLRTRLVSSIENNLKFCKLTFIFQSSCKLNYLFHYKDCLKKMICSDIVYRYTCSSCKVIYCGKTHRYFFTSALEHMGISNLTGKRLESVKQSAISNYLLEFYCSIDFDHFEFLVSDSNLHFLLGKVY